MNKIIKQIGLVLLVLIGAYVIYLIVSFYVFLNTPIRSTKDFTTMYVEDGDVIDAEVMLSPPEKYSQLLEIDIDMRKKVAEYMKENNYKLKCGKQEFIRTDPSFKELKDGFQFEKNTGYSSPI